MTDQSTRHDDTDRGGKGDPGTLYRITIDKTQHELHDPTPTGKRLLELAGKTPVDQFALYLRVKGQQPRRIQLNEQVDLRDHGVERFVTLPLDQTEG